MFGVLCCSFVDQVAPTLLKQMRMMATKTARKEETTKITTMKKVCSLLVWRIGFCAPSNLFFFQKRRTEVVKRTRRRKEVVKMMMEMKRRKMAKAARRKKRGTKSEIVYLSNQYM